MIRALRYPALIALCILSAFSNLSAQTTFATITGTVHDPSGGAVAGATVTATHAETGVTWTATTNKEGLYSVVQLREGPYVVVVEAAGFRRAIAADVTLVS